MSRDDREETRYQQGYVEGSRVNRNNSATGIVVGIVVVAALCVGAWAVITQIGQQSDGDTDIINVPAPEAPEAPKPPEINIDVPKPEVDVPKPEVDVPKPEVDAPSPSNGSSEPSPAN